MAETTTGELRNLADEELVAKLTEAKEELFNLRFQAATGQLDTDVVDPPRHPGAGIFLGEDHLLRQARRAPTPQPSRGSSRPTRSPARRTCGRG